MIRYCKNDGRCVILKSPLRIIVEVKLKKEVRMKTVIITGASSGIGLSAVKRFAAEAWRVILVARRGDRLAAVAAALPGGTERHLVVAGDYSRPETAANLLEALRERGITAVEALVNCAGISGGEPIVDSPLEEWRVPLDAMLNGAILMSRLAVPLLPSGGRIVHVTSIHAFRAERNASAYATAKAAIGQYCRGLALELADRGILVNAVAPGFVDTPMSSAGGSSELESEWFQRDYASGRHLPLRRAGNPEEIAGVLFFLCGPDATYITGQTLVVDGGLTITF